MRGRTCGRFTLKKKDARCLLVRGRQATCGPLPTVVIRSRLLLLDIPPGCKVQRHRGWKANGRTETKVNKPVRLLIFQEKSIWIPVSKCNLCFA
ncbi:hypothetical protein CDAR_533541 [Caerostris darwini]|uniref:Uncharacterized protein n=1 Tax=Caerostris darwini TaxID=1538125 RepID=A0AAV4SAL1_9ARAC|nr:hypothetical protein CDAR_533541 [Caerostris darwini]